MWTLLLLFGLAGSPASAQSPDVQGTVDPAVAARLGVEDPPVDQGTIDDWVTRLEELLESNAQELVVQHLHTARELHDLQILEAVDGLLDRKERSGLIELHALETMGFLQLEQARAKLHHRATRDRRIAEDDDLSAALYKAIGRHAHVDSIELLADDLIVNGRPKTNKAKIFALGRIRDPLTVETMIAEMNKLPTPENGKSGIIAHGRDFRSALYALTGEDLGENRNPWQSWWNDNKRGLEITAVEPELTGEAGERWTKYWRVGKQSAPYAGP